MYILIQNLLYLIANLNQMGAINFRSSKFKQYEQIYQNALVFKQSQFIKQNIKFKIETKVKLRYHEVFKPNQFSSQFISSEQNELDTQNKNIFSQQEQNNQIQNPMYSSIGLIYSKSNHNGKQIYVYGTGTLIHQNIVLTAAQNVYCRRLKKQYKNINFIPGMDQNHHDGIVKIKKVYYPDEYKNQQNYPEHNYAILELEKDIDWKYGCMASRFQYKQVDEQNIFICGYLLDHQFKFVLKKLTLKYKINDTYIEYDNISNNRHLIGAPIILQYSHDNYKIIGINTNNKYGLNLTISIRNKINSWMMKTKSTTILNLSYNNRQLKQICSFLQSKILQNLTEICLRTNNLGSGGSKYLQYTNWSNLRKLSLDQNHIGDLGCFYLKNVKWPNLRILHLNLNEIGIQGCYHLKDTSWYHLKQIQLINNNIQSQGCKYLKDAKWYNLNILNLKNNYIDSEGCRYIIQGNWHNMTLLDLSQNNITVEGCKYLKDGNWIYLRSLNLISNSLNSAGKTVLMEQGMEVAFSYQL